MGCSSSREGLSSIPSTTPFPLPRTLSLPTPLVHHPPLRKGDTHHLVSLTSTTYGSLNMDPLPESPPKSPFSDHRKSNQPETINTWELMEGLEETHPPVLGRSYTFHAPLKSKERDYPNTMNEIKGRFLIQSENSNKPDSGQLLESSKKSKEQDYPGPMKEIKGGFLIESENSKKSNKPNPGKLLESSKTSKEQDYPSPMKEIKGGFLIESENSNKPKSWESSKPLWMHLSEESLLADMDPDVVSSFRKASAARVLSVSNSTRYEQILVPVHLSATSNNVDNSPHLNQSRNRPISSAKVLPLDQPAKAPPGSENKIVFYFTSLRGIRRTYEDCNTVRLIFQGFRVPIDDRDISMDSSYRKELQSILGEKNVSLPQVFIRGRHIGGAEEIKQLLEIGELGKLLHGLPVQENGFVCDGCGNARFVPCPNCYGSHKLFTEDGELQRCSKCNENGLIRCPACCC